MLSARWHKVVSDLWSNRARTLIVALAVAVGVYAIGVVLDIREVLVREYGNDQASALPASAVLHTQAFDDELADHISKMPGVAAAEGRAVLHTQVYDQAGEAHDLILTAIPDRSQLEVDALTPVRGQWPPAKREVILERMSPDFLGMAIGQEINVDLGDGVHKALTIVGTAHNAEVMGPQVTAEAYGYITPETMDALGLGESYTELRIRVAARPHDRAHIQAVVNEVQDQLERTGREVYSITIITESHLAPYIDTIVLLLSTFGVIILLLSGFLVVNAISALIAQQVPQIGVIKLIGARRRQIIGLYLVTVLVYGILAVFIAIPLAGLTAHLVMSRYVVGLLNILPESYALSLPTIGFQAMLGLMLPLLAGLAPVLQGTRVTTQRALTDAGVGAAAYRIGWFERSLRQLQKLRRVQRPLLLAARNTMRHKGRLVQTLFILIVGTALFISVLSVQTSVDATLADFMRFHGYDVSVALDRPYRMDQLQGAVRQVPGLAAVEGWSINSATRTRPDDTDSDPMRVFAVPADTALVDPRLSAGRWLGPNRGREAVINSDVLDKEPDLRVGDEVVLKMDGREATWHIVGIVPTESKGPAIYVPLSDYAFETRTAGQVTHLQVVSRRHDERSQRTLTTALRAELVRQGFGVSSTELALSIDSGNRLGFAVVITFLLLMALLLAAVGGLGLTTTMSINILERVREIGVLRAIGASNLSVRRIVLAEGIAIGLVSWAIGTLLSLPVSAFMSEQVGLALIDIPLNYRYSLLAAGIWFVAVQVVAVAASLGPARKAERLTIREVLAYE